MKKGTLLRGNVRDMDEKGRGVLHAHGKDFVVPFTMPGDEIAAEFQKRSKKSNVAKATSIMTPSPDRVSAPCPHAGICGGCLWQHMDYPAQLACKRMMINRALEYHGHTQRVKNVMPSPHQLHCRNRMDFAFGWKGELGLRAYASWNSYLDLETCLLLDRETPLILQTVRELAKELDLAPWDNKFHRGQCKYLTIRRGEHTGEKMITLLLHDISALNEASKRTIAEALSPFCTTLYLGEQPTRTDTEYAHTLELLFGKPYLRENINGLEYDIHPNAFFQTNSSMAEELQQKILSLSQASMGRNILDLYCGLGFFSVAFAKSGARVTGIELMPESIELAKRNAKLNQVAEKTQFIASPVEKGAWDASVHDTVILDPSRAGLHPSVIQKLIEKPAEHLIYVSCNYRRFAEEWTKLKPAYALTHIEALDIFPQTPHVEVIASFKRANA